ncbi:MAG TPA: glycoside hydrolase family 38 C-terminal domain-containing protein, partial [Phototrophicaceae bacterium]|nr:glycoside hydrolase family 38 C-terminal domain-containing protein [Phototrophicaceae bacterium]
MTKIDTIYLVHHSHTDVGYTMDQPIVWEMHTRFIDEALDLAEKYADHTSDGAFRWTVETTVVLQKWLQGASARDIERFKALERAGRIEVTGMFANITPLLDTDELIESFQLLRTLRNDYGFNIRYAMNCDVNGENWPLVDTLLDLGIEGFTMAINSHFGGALQPRPFVFNWQGPSGRTIPANNGWPYDKGWREGIGRDADDLANVRLPRLQEYLDLINYPLPIVLIQSYHPYGDNGSAFDFTPFIDEWNASGRGPRIVLATPSMWWSAVRQHADKLKTLRGDWTDFWNFGAGSSAVETAANRGSRERLRSADAIYAGLRAVTGGKWAQQSFQRYRKQAWESLFLWDEHTWGADLALRSPGSLDTYSQWNYKANYAYQAHSLSLLLQRDALADFAQQVTRTNADDLLVFNPLPFERTISGDVPHHVTSPRGIASDTTSGRHAQDRDTGTNFTLPATQVPALGYAVVARSALIPVEAEPKFSEDAVIDNERYRITFDLEHGGISSLYDKQLDYEWVDAGARYGLNSYVHEQVADQNAPWARHLLFRQDWNAPLAEIPAGWQTGWRAQRRGVRRLLAHRVYHTPLGIRVVQELEADHRKITQTVFLPNDADTIECASSWDMDLTTHPEATYIAFPFNLANATARYDLGGQAVVPGADQLPGVCRDYFTTQGWVDFSNAQRGVTIAMPETPMVQFGDFHFGHYQMDFHLERALLLGWVTNNY